MKIEQITVHAGQTIPHPTLERTNNQNTQRADKLRDWLDSHSRPLLAVEGGGHDE